MRAWVVVAVAFAAVVVLWNVASTLNMLVILFVAANADRLPTNVMMGQSAGPFPSGFLIAQYGLGLVAVAFLVYVFWRRRRT